MERLSEKIRRELIKFLLSWETLLCRDLTVSFVPRSITNSRSNRVNQLVISSKTSSRIYHQRYY